MLPSTFAFEAAVERIHPFSLLILASHGPGCMVNAPEVFSSLQPQGGHQEYKAAGG
jgi:hypothetical protein